MCKRWALSPPCHTQPPTFGSSLSLCFFCIFLYTSHRVHSAGPITTLEGSWLLFSVNEVHGFWVSMMKPNVCGSKPLKNVSVFLGDRRFKPSFMVATHPKTWKSQGIWHCPGKSQENYCGLPVVCYRSCTSHNKHNLSRPLLLVLGKVDKHNMECVHV